jgi:hypothetical protein
MICGECVFFDGCAAMGRAKYENDPCFEYEDRNNQVLLKDDFQEPPRPGSFSANSEAQWICAILEIKGEFYVSVTNNIQRMRSDVARQYDNNFLILSLSEKMSQKKALILQNSMRLKQL